MQPIRRAPLVLVAESPSWRLAGPTGGRSGSGAREIFGEDAGVALDLLELTELAWHDCYGEVTPPDQVIDDIFAVAQGTLAGLVRAARLAIEDFRDLRMKANLLAI